MLLGQLRVGGWDCHAVALSSTLKAKNRHTAYFREICALNGSPAVHVLPYIDWYSKSM